MTKKVWIVGGYTSGAYGSMFKGEGWEVVADIDDADLVQFTGGEDVTPALYDEPRHPRTGNNSHRDNEEAKIYHYCLANGIPMAGICRGGQFLNVMNGGKMYQDVDNHAIGETHPAFVLGHVGWVKVTSTHHQMMRVNLRAEHLILMTAKESTYREHMGSSGIVLKETNFKGKYDDDVESVYYPNTLSLCYQPHPEFFGKHVKECRAVYFHLLNNYLMNELNIEKAVKFSKEAWTVNKKDEVE